MCQTEIKRLHSDFEYRFYNEYKLSEGDFKFKDYFASQKRNYVKIKK